MFKYSNETLHLCIEISQEKKIKISNKDVNLIMVQYINNEYIYGWNELAKARISSMSRHRISTQVPGQNKFEMDMIW